MWFCKKKTVLTAAQARIEAQIGLEKRIAKTRSNILRDILYQAKNGSFEAHFTTMYSIYLNEVDIKWLETLGYKIEKINLDTPECPFHHVVSWK